MNDLKPSAKAIYIAIQPVALPVGAIFDRTASV
jgi:hypothetical protein